MLLFAPLPDTELTTAMPVVATASEELDSYAVFASAVSSAFEAFCDELAGDIQSFSLAALFGSTDNDADNATPTNDAASTSTTATTIASFEDDNHSECDSEIAMLEDNGEWEDEELITPFTASLNDDNISECDSDIAMLEDNGVWEDEELIIPSTAMAMSDCAIFEDNGVWDAVDELRTPAARIQCAVATAVDAVLAICEYAKAAIAWIVNGSTAAIQNAMDRMAKYSHAPPAQEQHHHQRDEPVIVVLASVGVSYILNVDEEDKQEEDDDVQSDWPSTDSVDGFFI